MEPYNRRPPHLPQRPAVVIDRLPLLDLSAQYELGRQEAQSPQGGPDQEPQHDSEPRRSGP